MPKQKLELADLVQRLRTELEAAVAAGKDSSLRFDVVEAELEVKLQVEVTAEAEAGVKFWVVEAGGKDAQSQSSVHTVRLKLDPRMGDGRPQISKKTKRKPK